MSYRTIHVERVYLNVPRRENANLKKLGANYDEKERCWWIGVNAERFRYVKWLPRMYKPDAKPPHLTSEYVPSNTWYMNLRKWLPKPQWNRLRKQAYQEAGYRCLVCGGRGPEWPVECNEQWQYIHDLENEGHGVQKLLRLVALCPACHLVKTPGFAMLECRDDELERQLAFVNSWSQEQVEAHLKHASNLFEQRSNMEWSFDLTLLEKYNINRIEIDWLTNSRIPQITGVGVHFLNAMPAFVKTARFLTGSQKNAAK